MAGSAGSAAAAADAAAAAAAVPEKPFMRTDVQVGDVYHLKATLGRGSYATVKLGVHQQDKTKWAIKLIDRSALSSADSAALEVECRLLRMLVHPHIVAIREVIQGPARFSMILELCVGGELFDRIVEKDHYTEQEARTVLTALASAIAHCHANGVVHRDLKPENLLYADKECNIIKLADFGLASILTEEVSLHTACGTPGYVAPEIIQASGYGSEVDMWSLGVILYILLCGFPPFYDENQTALFSQIIHGVFDFPSPYWDDVGQSAKDLVKALLRTEKGERLTAPELLEHPWISGKDSAPLPGVTTELKRYNARRKFKAAIFDVTAVLRMAKGAGFRVKKNLSKDAMQRATTPSNSSTPGKPLVMVTSTSDSPKAAAAAVAVGIKSGGETRGAAAL